MAHLVHANPGNILKMLQCHLSYSNVFPSSSSYWYQSWSWYWCLSGLGIVSGIGLWIGIGVGIILLFIVLGCFWFWSLSVLFVVLVFSRWTSLAILRVHLVTISVCEVRTNPITKRNRVNSFLTTYNKKSIETHSICRK